MARKPEKKKRSKKLTIEIVRQMITLTTSGFGLVMALAWNNLIQEVVNNYVKRFFSTNTGLISLALYAVAVTILAVVVTLQLSKVLERLES